MTIVAGTGSRSLARMKPDMKEGVLTRTSLALQRLNASLVISGGAEGFDAAIAVAAMRLGIPYDLYIPSPNYGEYYWGLHSQTGTNRFPQFQYLVNNAHEVKTICDGPMGGRANFIRNARMVDAADHILAYPLNNSRGTKHCTDYAKAHGVPVSFFPF